MTDWQLINTASGDEEYIMLWDGHSVCIGWWEKRKACFLTVTNFMGGDASVEATHWMPLPEPPE